MSDHIAHAFKPRGSEIKVQLIVVEMQQRLDLLFGIDQLRMLRSGVRVFLIQVDESLKAVIKAIGGKSDRAAAKPVVIVVRLTKASYQFM